jgi:hypothetical protein
MSQAGIISVSGAMPPAVPLNFTSDSGSAVPVANNLNVFGIDSTSNNANGITTTAAGDTLNVVLTNRLQGTGSAVGATTTDIITPAAGATPGVYCIDIRVSLFESTTPAGAGYHIRGAVRTTGAATTVIDTPDEFVNEEAALAACDVDIIASANNIIIRGTGTAGLTTNFSSDGIYTFAS